MKTTKSQKERVISGQHIQYLRDKKHHLSVTEFASLCTELVQREIPYSDIQQYMPGNRVVDRYLIPLHTSYQCYGVLLLNIY